MQLPRLGAGLDGTRVALITDTHYGPLDRARWSARVCETVNTLEADLVCHTGDIADGTAERRRAQAAPWVRCGRPGPWVYVTGNHEYYSEAQGWVDLMDELGWEPLRNRHLLLERGGDSLVVAGVDDVTAESSGLAGHRAHLAGALDGADPDLPVLLLAHQPKFIDRAAAHGIDLQLSGHTHGGRDLAVPLPGPHRPAGRRGPQPPRRSHAPLHQPRHRLLGPALPRLRPQRDHPAGPPVPQGVRRALTAEAAGRTGSPACQPRSAEARMPSSFIGDGAVVQAVRRFIVVRPVRLVT